MSSLVHDRWGKSQVRISKVHRGGDEDGFSDLSVTVLLEGEVEEAHTRGDNRHVLPTDTMRNTVYALAQDHLTADIEAFASTLVGHFCSYDYIDKATVAIREVRWQRAHRRGFVGGTSERRTARVERTAHDEVTWAGVDGLVVLKTGGSSFTGFPQDQFTILPEAEDRILATSVTAEWRYQPRPADTTVVWAAIRAILVERFFEDWSASVQHQGWLMATAVLDGVEEVTEISLTLPNQHHLPFDLTRLGVEDRGVVFHPVSEPYGDISLSVRR